MFKYDPSRIAKESDFFIWSLSELQNRIISNFSIIPRAMSEKRGDIRSMSSQTSGSVLTGLGPPMRRSWSTSSRS